MVIAHITASGPRRGGMSVGPSIVTLALWRLRRTWGLLLITGVGMIAAVMLVCAVPLYAEVATTAGLRDILTAAPQNTDISVSSISQSISEPFIRKVTAHLNQELQKNLGPYLSTPQFSLVSPELRIGSANAKDGIALIGTAMDAATSHLQLLEGRLPKATGDTIEVALTKENATLLQVQVGSSLAAYLPFVNASQQTVAPAITLSVVGIFKLKTKDDAFWHGDTFQPYRQKDFSPSYFLGLASNQSLLSRLTRIVTILYCKVRSF